MFRGAVLHVSLKMATREGKRPQARCDTATLSIERPASTGTVSASMIKLLRVRFRSMQEAGLG